MTNKNIYLILLLFISGVVSHAQSFEDVSESLEFDVPGLNRGVAIADYDGNGFDDIYISRNGSENLFYANQGNLQFIEMAADLGIDDEGETIASVWIDYDNDGDLDLFCGNQFTACSFYVNENGNFVERSNSLGISLTGNIQSVNLVDFDNDGFLDIYIARFNEENILYKNLDGESFANYIDPSGIRDSGESMGAIFFDYDKDGDQDLYQTRDGNEGNLFFRNDGGYFVEISEQIGVDFNGHGMGVDVADVNQDGLLDLYFTNLYENALLLQNANGAFEEFSNPLLIDRGMGWGTVLFDCDNNGLQDIYISNDSHFQVDGINHESKLIVQSAILNFEESSQDGAINNLHASYGTAFSDLDNDGDLDLFICNTGNEGNQLLINNGNQNSYLALNLQGSESNSQAIGARVEVYANGKIFIEQNIPSHSYASQSSNTVHFGLGNIEAVDSVLIHWPSGNVDKIEDIEINTKTTIVENEGLVVSGILVWTEPAFPTQLDDVTVYFDAKEGNGALAGFNGAVYAHTGVITTASNAPNDWKHVQGNWGTADANVVMTSEGDDVYSISYNITDYYGINPGEIVEQLAFVFRNSDGSIVGRDTDGSDIFLDVFPEEAGLLTNLNAPQNNTIVYEGEQVAIDLEVNKEATVIITDNGTEIFNETTDLVSFEITAAGIGNHDLRMVISDGVDEAIIELTYLVLDNNETPENPPIGTKNGVNYLSSSYIFQITAPGKEHVFLLCPDNDYQVDVNYQLKKSEDGNIFWKELPKSLFEEGENTYQYLVDGRIKVADPFAEVVLDPWNDGGVPEDVMQELPPYPNDFTTGIVTAFDLEKTEYDWQVNDFEKPANTDLIIYEILMRDFLNDKNYKSLIDTLDYLDRLGVNAIELMPISEFEGNNSWGYNPSFHMAVDKYYGSRDQLKRVIDECHARGIAVILDVVFNHAFSQSPLCQLYWNPTEFRPAADNPWLNETARHPFNVGYDFNHESVFTKDWVKQVLSYWIEEFRFDGFRFDLSKGLTQKFTGNNADAMAQYDLDRVGILQDYSDHIWAFDENIYVIMEHFAVNTEESDLSDYGMMLWGNISHEFAEAAMGFASDLEGADYTDRGWNDPHLIAYMESHDEERMGYKLQNFGDSNSNHNTRELETGVDRIAAASAIYLSIPGPKMFWQFGELHYDFSINRCTNGAINPDCRLDPKPIRWDYNEDDTRRSLYDRIAAMTHLKTNYPTFATEDFVFNDGNFFLKTVHLYHEEMDAVTLANFRIIDSEINPKFPNTGIWYEYFTGEELEVTDTEERLTFGPGEYRIYTSSKIEPPGGFFTSTYEVSSEELRLYPNPSFAKNEIKAELPSNALVESVQIMDILGRTETLNFDQSGNLLNIKSKEQYQGNYILLITQDDKVYRSQISFIN